MQPGVPPWHRAIGKPGKMALHCRLENRENHGSLVQLSGLSRLSGLVAWSSSSFHSIGSRWTIAKPHLGPLHALTTVLAHPTLTSSRTPYSLLRTSYSRTLHSVLPHPSQLTVQREDSSTSQIERAHAGRLAVPPTRSRATSTTSECGRRTPSPDARPPRSCLPPPRVSPSGT